MNHLQFRYLNLFSPDRSFIVSLPVVIESGSQARLCVSLYKPNETLSMSIYLVNEDLNTLLFEMKARTGFHRCLNFQVHHQLPQLIFASLYAL